MQAGASATPSSRQHLLLMDDEAVLIARPVAMAAAAWRHAKNDTEAYRRLVAAVSTWDTYIAPTLDAPAEDHVAAQLRRAARHVLRAMDDEAARLAGNVAEAASTWLHAPTDPEAYRHFTAASDDWDEYEAPQLDEPTEELLDQLTDETEPVALGEIVAEVTVQIHAMQWPELFVGLTPGQRQSVAHHLAQTRPPGHESTRSETDATVQYVVGEITHDEYALRLLLHTPDPGPGRVTATTDPTRPGLGGAP